MTGITVPSKLVLTLSCPDQPGIVHAIFGVIGLVGGNITQSRQFGDLDSGLPFVRVGIDSPVGRAPVEEAMADIAKHSETTWNIDDLGRPLRTIVMVSREGHCLIDLLCRQRSQGLLAGVVVVIGNHPDPTLVTRFYGAPFLNIPVTKDTEAQAEAELLDLVRSENVELTALARYMQILSEKVCEGMAGRIINIHHSFLPFFKDAHPYAQAHDRDAKLIGATAHYVTPDLDEGPITEQDITRVTHAGSTPDMVSLGRDVERRILTQTVCWHAERCILLNRTRTVIFTH